MKFSRREIKWAKLLFVVPINKDVPRRSPLVEFFTGETVYPPLGETLERLWKGEDSLVWSMMINSMEP